MSVISLIATKRFDFYDRVAFFKMLSGKHVNKQLFKTKRALGLVILVSTVSGCASALCDAQTDRAIDPLQQESERVRCERLVEDAMAEHKSERERDNEAQLKASMSKYLKAKPSH